ncbi:MAG: hypothetical protein E7044_04715 [Lentisphaerae bacterium]|nr:hypothetical protein [Lentisphaerota bacterium]
MKTQIYLMCVALTVGLLSLNAKEVLNIPKWAEEFKELAEKGSPKDVDWNDVANLGSAGNVRVFFDAKGNPEIYIIGIASVSTTLVAVRAEQFARKEAEINAKAAFAMWLHEHFAVKDEFDQKTLVAIKDGKRESSEDRTVSKRHAEQCAKASWRGMRVMKVVMKSNRCYTVWRWSLTEHTFAKLIEILTKDGSGERQHDKKIKEGSWSRF